MQLNKTMQTAHKGIEADSKSINTERLRGTPIEELAERLKNDPDNKKLQKAYAGMLNARKMSDANNG